MRFLARCISHHAAGSGFLPASLAVSRQTPRGLERELVTFERPPRGPFSPSYLGLPGAPLSKGSRLFARPRAVRQRARGRRESFAVVQRRDRELACTTTPTRGRPGQGLRNLKHAEAAAVATA